MIIIMNIVNLPQNRGLHKKGIFQIINNKQPYGIISKSMKLYYKKLFQKMYYYYYDTNDNNYEINDPNYYGPNYDPNYTRDYYEYHEQSTNDYNNNNNEGVARLEAHGSNHNVQSYHSHRSSNQSTPETDPDGYDLKDNFSAKKNSPLVYSVPRVLSGIGADDPNANSNNNNAAILEIKAKTDIYVDLNQINEQEAEMNDNNQNNSNPNGNLARTNTADRNLFKMLHYDAYAHTSQPNSPPDHSQQQVQAQHQQIQAQAQQVDASYDSYQQPYYQEEQQQFQQTQFEEHTLKLPQCYDYWWDMHYEFLKDGGYEYSRDGPVTFIFEKTLNNPTFFKSHFDIKKTKTKTKSKKSGKKTKEKYNKDISYQNTINLTLIIKMDQRGIFNSYEWCFSKNGYCDSKIIDKSVIKYDIGTNPNTNSYLLFTNLTTKFNNNCLNYLLHYMNNPKNKDTSVITGREINYYTNNCINSINNIVSNLICSCNEFEYDVSYNFIYPFYSKYFGYLPCVSTNCVMYRLIDITSNDMREWYFGKLISEIALNEKKNKIQKYKNEIGASNSITSSKKNRNRNKFKRNKDNYKRRKTMLENGLSIENMKCVAIEDKNHRIFGNARMLYSESKKTK